MCYLQIYVSLKMFMRSAIAPRSACLPAETRGSAATLGIRKEASTYIARKGISCKYVKLCGIWATHMGQVDTYVDIDLLTPDTKVAFALTGPKGPCCYLVKTEVMHEITKEFLLSVVAPNIHRVFGKDVGLVLSRALLFAIFECPDRVPNVLVEKVRTEMGRQNISTAANPIRRVAFVVVQEDDQCVLHDIGSNGLVAPQQNSAGVSPSNVYNHAVAGSMDAVLTMLSTIRAQSQEQHIDLRAHMDSRLDKMSRDLATMRVQLQQASTIPAFCLGSSPGHRSNDGRVAKLVDRPKSLEVLWLEYVSGVNGSKPAREYDDRDKSNNTTKYCRRKKLWDIVAAWVRAGKTPEQAIAKIYQVYHPVTSVSAILDKLAKDKKTGGHPQLNI